MPLSFDMPYEELLTYEGTNPKPTDFDSYWDAALAEMHAVDPQVELTSAEFQTSFADCHNLTFTGVGGARVHAQLLQPRGQTEPGPALLFFHGYTMNAGDWAHKLAYVAAGFTVAALDCRGQGGISEDVGGVWGSTINGHLVRGLENPPEKMLMRDVYLDTAELARIVMNLPLVDADRVAATGASQGGGLTIACAALEPRIKRAAPIYPFLTDYQRAYEADLASGAYHEIVSWFRRRDPRHLRETEIFTQLGYIDVQHLAPRISAEVLMACGLADEICPPSTQFAAYNKISSSKQLTIYPDHAHEHLPGIDDLIFSFLADL